MTTEKTENSVSEVICTVDVVLLTLDETGLKVALLQRDKPPFQNSATLPGGYIHAQEDADTHAAAFRVLKQKTGIDAPYLEQLATFSGPERDPRGWSVSIAYYALVPFDVIEPACSSDLKLVSVDAAMSLPFDHDTILAAAVARLRSKSQYSSLPCYLLGQSFTLPQLQRVYEALLGEAINKVSFRRKMTEMDMLEAIDGQFTASGAHRPAQLYRLKSSYLQALQMLKRGL